MNNVHGTIIQIGDILISEEVITEKFACDYAKCKGACCIIGDSGAPLNEEEAEKIEARYPMFKPYLDNKAKKTVDENGFFVIDSDGDMVTPLVPMTEECAFSCLDKNGNRFCAIEREIRDKASEKGQNVGSKVFTKPISCRLYPIRAVKLGNGMTALNVHHWNICKDAFRRGRKENIRVYEFLKEPLTYLYGEEFYSALSEAAKIFLASS